MSITIVKRVVDLNRDIYGKPHKETIRRVPNRSPTRSRGKISKTLLPTLIKQYIEQLERSTLERK